MLIIKRTVLAAALLMLLSGVQAQYSVTLPTQSLCAVTGSTVKISCTFTNPHQSSVTQKGWYRVQSSKAEPRHLSEDPQYSGRVSVGPRWSDCELTMSNVRLSDSGLYNVRFRTGYTGWISASSGVQLTVTDLQLKVDPDTVGRTEVNVICSATCRLDTHAFYWYRNGNYIKTTKDASIVLDSRSTQDEGSYSCRVSNNYHRSPSGCVLGKECWGVTYTPKGVCALKGTSIDLSCSYKHPTGLTGIKSVWFVEEQVSVEPLDVREDEEYRDRVQYTQNSQNDCRLTITNLREKDARTYRFGFLTDDPTGRHTGEPGVSLSVTDLKVTVSQSSTGYNKLSCTTTCNLSNNPTYIWYKNGQQVSNKNKNNLHLLIVVWSAGSYSCAVEGHEDLRSPAVCVFDQKSCWSVTYSTQTICSLIGSSVDIHSYFTFPNYHNVTKTLWFVKQSDTEYVDVKEDEEYRDRVQYTQNSQNHCRLTITNLQEKDAQTFRFRFLTDDPRGKYTGESGVSLSVTDLKVTVSDRWYYGEKILSCITTTTCALSNSPTYIWYKNGQRVTKGNREEVRVSSEEAGSYSCAVEGYEDLRSPAVCVFDKKSCWSVTYSTQTICSLIGSSVDIHSYFTFPNYYKVTKTLWFVKKQADTETVDLKEDEKYRDRVQYTQNSRNHCRLTITNLTERDAQTYRFGFYTSIYTSTPGVSLSVTDLKVTVSDWSTSYKKLSCTTICTLSNNPAYIWYKNGQCVRNEYRNELLVYSEDAGSYSCAVTGHEDLRSPAVYPPRNTTVVLPSGNTVEGDSVTLSCSSDANPPLLVYTWFKQSAAADTPLTTGQNYSIGNISSQNSGLYYCTAHNQLGHHNSTPARLDVFYPPRNLSMTVIPSVSEDSITLLCTSDSNPVSSYNWYRKTKDGVMLIGNGTNVTLSSRENGFHYCTAGNGFGSTNSSPWAQISDYRTVKYVASGVAVALVLIFFAAFLWMRRRKPALRISSRENSKNDSAPVYGNISAMTSDPTQAASAEDQDDIDYSSVYFRPSPTQEVLLYSTVQLPKALDQEEEKVEYATVSLVKSRAVREDEIYSNLSKE